MEILVNLVYIFAIGLSLFYLLIRDKNKSKKNRILSIIMVIPVVVFMSAVLLYQIYYRSYNNIFSVISSGIFFSVFMIFLVDLSEECLKFIDKIQIFRN